MTPGRRAALAATSLLLVIVLTSPALGQPVCPASDGLLDDAVVAFCSQSLQIGARIEAYAQRLFFYLMVIECSLLGAYWALANKDFNADLAMKLMTWGFGLYLVTSGLELATSILASFEQLGASVAGIQNVTSASGIASMSIQAFVGIFKALTIGSLVEAIAGAVLAVFVGGIVFLSLLAISVVYALAKVTAYIVLAIGALLLAGYGSKWTEDFAHKYLSSLVSIGMYCFVNLVVVGIVSVNIPALIAEIQSIQTSMADRAANMLSVAVIAVFDAVVVFTIPAIIRTVSSGSFSGGSGAALMGAASMAAAAFAGAGAAATAGSSVANALKGGASKGAATGSRGASASDVAGGSSGGSQGMGGHGLGGQAGGMQGSSGAYQPGRAGGLGSAGRSSVGQGAGGAPFDIGPGSLSGSTEPGGQTAGLGGLSGAMRSPEMAGGDTAQGSNTAAAQSAGTAGSASQPMSGSSTAAPSGSGASPRAGGGSRATGGAASARPGGAAAGGAPGAPGVASPDLSGSTSSTAGAGGSAGGSAGPSSGASAGASSGTTGQQTDGHEGDQAGSSGGSGFGSSTAAASGSGASTGGSSGGDRLVGGWTQKQREAFKLATDHAGGSERGFFDAYANARDSGLGHSEAQMVAHASAPASDRKRHSSALAQLVRAGRSAGAAVRALDAHVGGSFHFKK